MSSRLLSTALLFGASLGFAANASAEVITYVGVLEGTAVQEWLTSTTSKGIFDIDGSNVFGSSLGAVHWGHTSTGETTGGSGIFGWSYHGDSAQYGGDGRYPQVDDLANPTGNTAPGLAAIANPGTFVFGLQGSAANYAGKTVRVGIMADVLGVDENAADSNKTYRLTGPGGADSGIISLRGGAAGNGIPEMYFFDLTGVNPGDQFTVTTANTGGSGQPGYIGPMSWDIATTVPEPASATLLLGAAGALLGWRRRAARPDCS
jgi:hypothetical protein